MFQGSRFPATIILFRHPDSPLEYTEENFPPPIIRPLFALAQHYGIPTRFLDWTIRPLVAVYFATVEAAKERAQGTCTYSHLAVFSLNREMSDSLRTTDPGYIFCTAPTASNPNLRAQAGLFTLVRFISGARAANTDLPDLDELLNRTPISLFRSTEYLAPLLCKFVLPVSEARALLFMLSREGVSAASVYPGQRGAADAVYEERWHQRAQPGSRS